MLFRSVKNISTNTLYSSVVGQNRIVHLTAGKYIVYIAVDTGITADNVIARPQIVLGTTATPYEPYTGDTYNIALPETVYGGEMDAVSGEGQETWKLVTLDGTEAWITSPSNNYYAFFGNPVASKPAYGYCSHLPYTNIGNKKSAFANENGAIVIYGHNADYTKEEFKAYLSAQYAAGTPIQVCYKMAEPVPFSVTGAQPIPALSGVNTIYTDADGVVVTGAEDPKHTITELKNTIISLGGNI